MRRSVQESFADEGKHEIEKGICLGLDEEYGDWKNPQKTHMVPDSFPSNQGDEGANAEERVYNLLQKCGDGKEPMFVVHSCPFSEHIPDSKREKSWVMGETDFVVIHKMHGPIYIEVKATENGKSYKDAEDQLWKGKLALQKRFEEAVKRLIPTKKVMEIFNNFPAFVAMPNRPRPSSAYAQANALYKEDCSGLAEFDKWWKKNVVEARHPPVTKEMYEYLVIR